MVIADINKDTMKQIILLLLSLFLYNCNQEPAYTAWPNATVEYVPVGLNSEELKVVAESMTEIHLETFGLIKFHLSKHVGDGVLHILKSNNTENAGISAGCGYTPNKPMFTGISQDYFTKRCIKHELLHKLGLLHENQRQDALIYVSLNTQGMSLLQLIQFLPIDPLLYESDMYPYDYASLTHYTEAESGYVMDTHGHDISGGDTGDKLSVTDVMKLNFIYKDQ